MTTAQTTGRDLAAELVFLTRALKAPTLRQSASRLADRAQDRILAVRGVPRRLPAAES
jgi:hypothetical protein